MRVARDSTPRRRCEGSVLVEVVVAVLLLAIMVVPLAGGVLSATNRARVVQRQADEVAAGLPGEAALQAWTWGSRIGAAWWRPGPTLYVQTRRSGDLAQIVGLWVDGWFVGEQTPDADGGVRLGPEAWSASVGGEVVVRVRSASGAWGPPWRSLVPGAEGVVSLPASGEEGGGAEGEVVAHSPAAGNPDLRLSWTQVGADSGSLGLPAIFETTLFGPCGLGLDGSVQSWRLEAGRGLDVYF